MDSTGAAVLDASTDIAKRANLEEMAISAQGRVAFQQCHLWTPNGKVSAEMYNPMSDGADSQYPRLPGHQELVSGVGTSIFLEAGLIFGDDPGKYLPKGNQARNRAAWEAARKSRGTLPRDDKCMRVFILVTPNMAAQAKFYVGCKPVGGRLATRTIKAENVFFYPEIWNSIENWDKLALKDRVFALHSRCLHYAAINKSETAKAAVSVVADSIVKAASSQSLVVSRSEHLGALLDLMVSFYEETEDPIYLGAINWILERTDPDLKYGPRTFISGMGAFANFDEDLTEEAAIQLQEELTVC